jgi:hypothetical protein
MCGACQQLAYKLLLEKEETAKKLEEDREHDAHAPASEEKETE